MSFSRLIDRLFIDHLFRTDAQGETIVLPFGFWGRAFLVPPERVGEVRAGLRRLQLMATFGTLALAILLPRLIEAWLGYLIPLPWFLAGAAIVLAIILWLISQRLSQLTAGLTPVAKPTAG
jgi:hypothetical protein